jgi:hypothetical protein
VAASLWSALLWLTTTFHESHPVSRGGEHLLFRVGELRERTFGHHIGDCASG